MSRKHADIIKELDFLNALGAEVVQRTSRLKQELAPVQAPARPKRVRKLTPSEEAVIRRNKQIQR